MGVKRVWDKAVEEAGGSQAALARLVGIPQTTINYWIRKDLPPSTARLALQIEQKLRQRVMATEFYPDLYR